MSAATRPLQFIQRRVLLRKITARDSIHLHREYHQEEWVALPVINIFAKIVQCTRGIQQHVTIRIFCPNIGIALVAEMTRDEILATQTMVTITRTEDADSPIVDPHLALEHIQETRGHQQLLTRVQTSAATTQP